MNVFHKIALQGLKKNRTRTLVTIIGVILSSVMITGMTTFGVSLLDYMIRGAIQKYGDWNVAILDADASFVQERMEDEEAADTVSFENIGYARLDNGNNPDKPYLFIAGFSQEAFDALPTTLLSGRLPENDSEILVSAKIAVDSGISYNVGDTLSLTVGRRLKGNQELTLAAPYNSAEESFVPQEEKSYTVVGTCRTPVFEPDDSPGYTLITNSSLTGSSNSCSLFVTLKNPRKVYSYADHIADGHAYIFNNNVLRFMGISKQASDKIFMIFLYSFGAIVLFIIMAGSVFLIYNSFSISLGERIREIGMLASVGATTRQLLNSVLFEGFCIGLIGIPVGVLAGLAGISLVISTVSKKFGAILYTGIPLTMKLSALSIGGTVAVSLITILISAWLPAKKALKIPVMECIRQTNEIKVDAKSMKISRGQQRIYGLSGTLALKNFKRNRKRYRSIVLSLALSIVLFVSTNALIASMQQSASTFKNVSDFDIGFGIQEIEDDDLLRLYDKLKAVPYIQESSCRSVLRYFCAVQSDSLSDAYWEAVGEHSPEETLSIPMTVHFFNDEFYQKLLGDLGLPIEPYTGQNGKFIAIAKINDDSNDVKGAADLADMFKNDSMDFTLIPKMTDDAVLGPEQRVSVTIMEFVPPDIPPVLTSDAQELPPYTFEILAPWSAKEQLAPSNMPIDILSEGLCFDSENPSQSTIEMRKLVMAERLPSSYTLINCAEAYEELHNYVFIANTFAYTFIALISLIAVANVFNTISTNIRLRKRELAMLRSVGMSDRDFNKMMRFECAFYGIKALLIGIPLSLIFSVLIVKIMTTETVTLPWTSVGISALSVFLVIFITMMYAVSKIRKENIIDSLRDEMT